MKKNKTTKLNSDSFLAILTIALIGASLWIFAPYLHFILVSGVLALATSHIYSALVNWLESSRLPVRIKNAKNTVAATILTLFFLTLIFLPLLYFVSNSFEQVANLDIPHVKKTTIEIGKKALAFLEGIPVLQKPLARLHAEGTSLIQGAAIETTVKTAKGLVVSASGLLGQIIWILLFYFLFNLYSQPILRFGSALMPMSVERENYLYKECTGTVAVVFYGTLFNMAAQGFAFGVLIMCIGGYNAFYLGVLTGFCSVVPIIGAAIVYVPIIALELFNGNWINAIIVLIFAWVVLGFFIDNILRMIFIGFLKKKFGFQYTMNEVLILLSILAGIATFGFWGLIIGPMVVALTLASAKLYSSQIQKTES